MPLHVIDHPLARHYMTILRDRDTQHQDFRVAADRLTQFLAIEATRGLADEGVKIKTPLETMEGSRLAEKIVIVPILRAGLGMLQVFVDLLPEVAVGYVGMERDAATAEAASYYCKLPPLEGRRALVIDPMLATGGSAEAVIERLHQSGASAVDMACILAAPEGVERLEKSFPEVQIFTAALDRELNAKAYILPGLGDFGDRLYGT